MRPEDIIIGRKVHYKPEHFKDNEFENGIIKSIPTVYACRNHDIVPSVFVVYHCAGNWDRADEYTAAKTNLADLHLGWR